MGETETEIEVRTLTGESITVSICSNRTVQDLKLLLKQVFPPAASFPNFHLLLKGSKLSLQSRISSNMILDGDFIVLIPFVKKDKQKFVDPCANETETNSQNTHQCSTSNFAESAWSDMTQDLSSLREREIGGDEIRPNIDSEGTRLNARNEAYSNFESLCDESVLVLNTLQLCDNNELDETGWEKFMQVLELVNCVYDSKSKSCMLRNTSMRCSETDGYSCCCPSWLKVVLKAFYFSNIYCSFLQVQQKLVTMLSLEGGLNRLSKFGPGFGYADIQNLSVLCPKVIQFIDDETGCRKANNMIVVIKSKLDTECPVKGKRKTSTARVVNAMRKREDSFKSNLFAIVKSFMEKMGNEKIISCSVNDLLLHINEKNHEETKTDAKKKKRSLSESSSAFSPEALCNATNPLLPTEMVEHLRVGIGSQGQIVHVEEINARGLANSVEIPSYLSERMQSALKSSGVSKLYSHQAESIEASLAGKNVVISTMTSSGKSLCYNLPVLEVLSQNLSACALYLFPTKALAQDQLRALLSMTVGFDVGLNIGIYDGDTSQADRLWLRDNSRLLITNPDMLHVSILPTHKQFERFLSNLRYVVVDEAHTYKGAFGCHAALILRRFHRLCAHVYGSDPSFIFCTATSANPCDHAMELANLPTMELIHKDGSPSGSKLFVLWNPPSRMKTEIKRTRSRTNTDQFDRTVFAGRSSPILEISCLFAEIIQHGLRCIAFCKTRKLSELVLSYTREILQKTAPGLVNSVFAYRAGYTAQDRRRIESEFFGGKICGVAATNALELGIDVGHIDVTLHLGFPGSIASLWQQAGRSGRRERQSLAIYVAFEGPLDQYFMKYPHKLFRGPIECCHVDANNQQVLEQHLICASFEHPLSVVHDEKYFGPSLKTFILSLKSKGFVTTDPSRGPAAEIWNYIGHEKMPSHNVSIRAIESERYQVIDMKDDKLLEESKAFFQVYDGAVYMQQGKTYLVKNLDISTKIASCQEADLKYYTKTRDFTDIEVVNGHCAYPVKICNPQKLKTNAQSNPCKVTTTWFGFRRIWKGSNRVFDMVNLSLPSYTYESQAVWIRVPQSIKTAVERENYSFRGGLHAAGHALLHIVPIYIICNSSDLASECVNPHDTRYIPERILLYDSHPGGTGISAQVQPIFTELLTAALELVTSCYCSGDTGCPNCVQNLSCHEYNEVLHKDAAAMIIKGVLELEKSNFGDPCSSSL
ncbi:uncharacterized protein LOC143552854 [Bidens hawaiensis]|uniref:uncharacterized protein LOC143552854 n=1 Tax=Bidens hawaiensis TaxID=980011 RepID=UPI00404AD1A3